MAFIKVMYISKNYNQIFPEKIYNNKNYKKDFTFKNQFFYKDLSKITNKYLVSLNRKIDIGILKYIAKQELTTILSKPKGKILYIITGIPGSGKSTFVRKFSFKKFYTPDADRIKCLLPEYGEKGAAHVHESSYIINRINISEALERGVDCVIQTSTTFDRINEMIKEASDLGYKNINLIHIDITEDEAIKRCIKRGEARGRTIDIETIKTRKYLNNIVENYKNHNCGLNKIIVYDNNGSSFELKNAFILK